MLGSSSRPKRASTRPSPYLATFRRSHGHASGDASTVTTRERGSARARASAMAPLPAQNSSTPGASVEPSSASSVSASSTRSSVSGLGTNTPGPTSSSMSQNGARPVMCWRGSRRRRRSTASSRCRLVSASIASPRRRASSSSPRDIPRHDDSRMSASLGLVRPAAASVRRARSRIKRRSSTPPCSHAIRTPTLPPSLRRGRTGCASASEYDVPPCAFMLWMTAW